MNILNIRLQLLTREYIVNPNNTFNISVNLSKRYYEFISDIYNELQNKTKMSDIQSFEVYSKEGHPMALQPCDYFRSIYEFKLTENETLYLYPKRMLMEKYSRKLRIINYSIKLPIGGTNIMITLLLSHEIISLCEIKTILSLKYHIPKDGIMLQCLWIKEQEWDTPLDNFTIKKSDLMNKNVKIQIILMEDFDDGSYLGGFNTKLYTSVTENGQINWDDWNRFNCSLICLSKEQLRQNIWNLQAKLIFIKKISCSPPFVIAMFRLLTGKKIYLPHRVAINEGIIVTLALMTPSTKPKISRFPILWLYVEKYSFKLSNTFETGQAPKGRPMSSKILSQKSFNTAANTLVIWCKCISNLDTNTVNLLTDAEFPQTLVVQRFPIRDPMDLYNECLCTGVNFGRTSYHVDGRNVFCVFLGPTTGKYGYFDIFNPNTGKCFSCNAHEKITNSTIPHIHQPRFNLLIFVHLDENMEFRTDNYAYEWSSNGVESSALKVNIIGAFIDKIVSLKRKNDLCFNIFSSNKSYHYCKPSHIRELLEKNVNRFDSLGFVKIITNFAEFDSRLSSRIAINNISSSIEYRWFCQYLLEEYPDIENLSDSLSECANIIGYDRICSTYRGKLLNPTATAEIVQSEMDDL